MKEIIEKLQPYLKHKQDCNIYRQTSNDMDKGTVPDCDCGFDQALSLLKARLCQPECEICGDTKMIYGDPYGEPCPTCGDSREVRKQTPHARNVYRTEPCPDCHPDAGELVKRLRELGQYLAMEHNNNSGQGVCQQAAALIERQAKSLEAYTLLEEMAPPDMPRKKFVKMLWDAWRENNNLHHQVEQQAERIKMLSIGVLKPGSKEMYDKWMKELENAEK